jgi:hypothetical protein
MDKELLHIVEEDAMAKLKGIAHRLCAGSDKMRDEGNLLWVLIYQMPEISIDDIKCNQPTQGE